MQRKIYYFLGISFFIIIAVTFSPVVIPEKITTPWIFGMPRTLWAGIVVSFSLLLLTLFAAYILKNEEDDL